jgi:outer membrane protein TolC
MPLDLPTALRLVNAANPTVALARQRVQEAYARLNEAQVLWLPDLRAGPAYQRHDGRIQNSRGEIFDVSKSNFFMGGGAVLSLNTSEALFAPLFARRLLAAQTAAAQAVTNNVQLEVALAYQDLLRVYGQLAINADTLVRAEDLAQFSEAANRQGLTLRTADPPRARAEVELRRRERINLEGDVAVVSARLAQLLLLQPTVDLHPVEPTVVPVTLVPTETPLDELVATGLMNRPELAESRALVAVALARWRQARLGPLIPRLEIGYTAGTFGGGTNEFMGNFAGRGDGTAQVLWEAHNLFAGDVARSRVQRSVYNEANLHVLEVQAQVAAEVTAAAKLSRARQRSLDSAQEAVRQSLEAWRRLHLGSYNLANPKLKVAFDTLEPLIAVQTLAQVRTQYLNEVVEYNKAQFRLYAALGQPPLHALPKAVAQPVVEVPTTPTPPVLNTKPLPAKVDGG